MPITQHHQNYTHDYRQPIIGGIGISENDVILQLVKRDLAHMDDDNEETDFDDLYDEDIDM